MFIRKILHITYNEYYRKRFRTSQPDLRFHPSDSTFSYRHIDLGKRVFINCRAFFTAPAGEIIVKDNVLIGADVSLAVGSHCYTNVGKFVQDQGYDEEATKKRIIIDDDVWIASKVCVLGNVHVYEGAIIGAASVVLNDMPPYCLCVGSPCKPVKLRYSDEKLREHYRLLGRATEAVEHLIGIRHEMLRNIGMEQIHE